MKLEIIFLVFCSLLVGENYAFYTTFETKVTACETNTVGISTECKDCNTVQVCNGNAASGIKKCTDKTPFCLKGVCGATKDPDLTCAANKYKCSAKGLYPDPLDCTRFIGCEKKDDTPAESKACPNGFVFSDSEEKCKLKATAADCVTINCAITMGNGIFSPYGASKKYYALCGDEDTPSGQEFAPTQSKALFEIKSENILVYRCAKGAEFDRITTSSCIFRCPKAGIFEYSLDENYYYRCDGKPAGVLTKCESGKFDPTLGYCQ